MNINEKFGKAIRICRENKKISQEKFALKIGMDRSYYATIEGGKHNITLSKIEAVAKGLGISLPDLFNIVETIKD